jgi:hypothetical protein
LKSEFYQPALPLADSNFLKSWFFSRIESLDATLVVCRGLARLEAVGVNGNEGQVRKRFLA